MKNLIHSYKALSTKQKCFLVVHILLSPIFLLGIAGYTFCLGMLFGIPLNYISSDLVFLLGFLDPVLNFGKMILATAGYSVDLVESHILASLAGGAVGGVFYLILGSGINFPNTSRRLLTVWWINILGLIYYPSVVIGVLFIIYG